MQKADYLLRLMKQETDALMASDEKLQQFLSWVNEKSCSVKVPFKPAAVRAFYFAIAVASDMADTRTRVLSGSRDFARALNIDFTVFFALEPVLIIDLALDRTLSRAVNYALNRVIDPIPALDRALNRTFEAELRQALQELKEQLPNQDSNEDRLKKWWQANGQAWIMRLREVMIQHRNIGHDWQFNQQQKELLKEYYDANKLLADCLNSSNITPAVRNEIEETLLLPTEMLPHAEG